MIRSKQSKGHVGENNQKGCVGEKNILGESNLQEVKKKKEVHLKKVKGLLYCLKIRSFFVKLNKKIQLLNLNLLKSALE